MKKFPSTFLLLLTLIAACTPTADKNTTEKSSEQALPNTATTSSAEPAASVTATPAMTAPKGTFSYQIIAGEQQTFGYDIYSDGKLFIHQPNIPGLPGNNGFKTKALAESIAQLVIKKITNGEMPPTVSVNELKKAGVAL